MDPEEVAKLCERLNLDDYKGPEMRMSPTMYQDGKEKMDLCLVGQVFGNKVVNREGLSEVAEYVWCTSRKVRVEAMEFHIIPIVCRSDRCVRLWGELIGPVIDVDSDGPNLCARIVIDVTKPLCRGLRVFPDEDSDSISIPIQFEYLPEFYFRCGIIGHKLRECPKEEPVDRFGKPRKEHRERKGSGHWSDSNTSSGKSSNSSGGANHNNTDVFDRGLNSDEENSDEENTRVAAMERKIFGLSNIDSTSKVTEKSVSTRIDSGGEMRAEKNLLKGKNKVGASSGVASGEAPYISPDQVVDIQVTKTTNTYPIYNVEEPNIPLLALISGPESKQDTVSTRKAHTWKRVSQEVILLLCGANPESSQPELAKPSVKRRLPSSFLELSSDEAVKRGKVVANEIQNMDVVESASPVSQDHRSS
ncbi:Zinc knuckle CX2CX4HX4C [Trema orientale]|uniref:Zinc knuckle CX2CX4HX4C n=1 Tax=Trema orientale TaxID=63057 RepID=A0A2P5CRL4_TREOI|nr:Zinc knuckle CX2CX4HX4C [Trema orientale]